MSGTPSKRDTLMPREAPRIGVRIAGTGSYVPPRVLTNKDLEAMMDTTDEWIVQRTGIRERHICDPEKGEGTLHMSTQALTRALDDARLDPSELDLVILGSVTAEMTCPSTACRLAADVGAKGAAAFDITAACCSFVYGSNIAHDMIRSGAIRNAAVVGCDYMSSLMDYTNRGVSILFGDAAGAAIYRATDDTSRGIIASSMHADGSGWKDLFIPRHDSDRPSEMAAADVHPLNTLHMNGREVYKFAVGTFPRLIGETLDAAGIGSGDVDMYVCHQSNARMLESAREKFGIPQDKFYMNIDRYGNSSGGSVPLCLDELRKDGKCKEGDIVMFVAFGGGLTWASGLWRV